uniref:Gamma-glutamylcyclotransferase n=1 Tax=Lotharella globosa TaxID=91324 RepID=A0A7S3ZDK1_9EUKA
MARTQRHFLVAYGSLMSTESRGRTGMLGSSWPIVLDGIRVGWSNVYHSATFLGAEEKKGAKSFGVLFEVPKDKNPEQLLKQFDKREGPKYKRKRINIGSISLWESSNGALDPSLPFGSKVEGNAVGIRDADVKDADPTPIEAKDGVGVVKMEQEVEEFVWIYVMKNWQSRQPGSAVLQSYVDVVITGACEYHDEFCKEWVASCDQWGGTVKSDRDSPVYPRGLRALPEQLAVKIDGLLPSAHIKARAKQEKRRKPR